MQCLNPIFLKNKGSRLRYAYYVPCGKCAACLLNRRREWISRLKLEREFSISCYCFTLSYSPEFLPTDDKGNPCFDKEQIQKFIKRLRHFSSTPFKYFIAAEYGTNFTTRSHYHGIIFNFSGDFFDVINNNLSLWPYGFVDLDCNVGCDAITYISSYVLAATDMFNDRQKPFTLSSKGLGLSYLDNKALIDYHRKTFDPLIRFHDGTSMYMPRYLRDKIFNTDDLKIKFYHRVRSYQSRNGHFFKDLNDEKERSLKANLVIDKFNKIKKFGKHFD